VPQPPITPHGHPCATASLLLVSLLFSSLSSFIFLSYTSLLFPSLLFIFLPFDRYLCLAIGEELENKTTVALHPRHSFSSSVVAVKKTTEGEKTALTLLILGLRESKIFHFCVVF